VVAGKIAGDLAGAVAGNLAGGSSGIDALILALGSDIKGWWEAREDFLTLNGTDPTATAVDVFDLRETDLVTPTLPYYNQATAGNQLLWVSSGFNGSSAPYLTAQSSTRYMNSTSIGIASGSRVATLLLGTFSSTASRVLFAINTSTPSLTVRARNDAAPGFASEFGFSAGAQLIDVTVPAHDTNPHSVAWLPYASGAQFQFDGVNTTPQPTGSSAMREFDVATLFDSASAGGSWACTLLVDNMSLTRWNDNIKPYFESRFGMTLT